MARLFKDTEIVTQEELLMSQVDQLDAVTQLLTEKGGISEEEPFTNSKQVQAEHAS